MWVTTMARCSNVLGSIANSFSDSEESNDESDSFDGLEVIEQLARHEMQAPRKPMQTLGGYVVYLFCKFWHTYY